ncbi:MAG: multi-sensor hybrid histidine kinase, partial [Myxococcaceae bacterium]|nr:multi-sensor hybrid histidine kinase [Myxococcaceae bacterium]
MAEETELGADGAPGRKSAAARATAGAAELRRAIETLQTELVERRRAEAISNAQVRLSEYAVGHSLQQVLTQTLDEAEALTGSTIGFFHFVEADQETLSLQAWSTHTLRTQCTAEGADRHYPVSQAGVWADALRERRPTVHNDYPNMPNRKGLPAGHAPVIRELAVPVLRNGQVVALLGVGNAPADYGPQEIESVSRLANLAWDIVFAKRAEEALQQSERALRSSESKMLLAEQLGQTGSWVYRLETNTIWGSAQGLNMFGYPPVARYWPIEDIEACIPERERVHQALVDLIAEGREYNLEYLINPADGSPPRQISAIARLEKDAEGKPLRVLGFIQDITQRKQAEEALRESETRFRALFEGASEGILLMSAEGELVDVNESYAQLHGRTVKEVRQLARKDAGPLQPPERIRRVMEGESQTFEVEHLHQEGRRFSLEVSATRVIVGGKPHLLSFYRDITARKRAEAENARLFAAAIEAKRVRDDVLGIVSHDLRNPLNVIALSAETLARRPDDPRALATIQQAVARANRLIEDLLLASAVDAGPLALDRRREPVGAIVSEVAALHAGLAQAKRIEFDAGVGEAKVELFVDRHRIIQLLSNLVANAIKFTPAGGRVALRGRTSGDQFVLTVTDTGPGIEASLMEHLFDRFWQGAHADRAGAGLGLAIAKGIADAHGAELRVDSAPDKG